MWCKSASLCRRRLYTVNKLRWTRQIQSASYLQNPGTEPLTSATLGDVIAETAHKYPGRVAVKSLHEGISITYEELLTQAAETAHKYPGRVAVKSLHEGITITYEELLTQAAETAHKYPSRVAVKSLHKVITITYEEVLMQAAETAHKYPGRVAVRSLHEGITITYEELLTQADAYNSLGCALRAQGLEKGDRLGLWSHNSVSWIVAIVLINPAYEKNEISFCMRKTQMKGLLIGETLKNRNYYGTLEKLIPELHSSKPGQIKSKDFPHLTSVISSGKDKLDGTFEYSSLIKECQNRSEISKYGSEVPLFHALGSIITFLSGVRHGSSLVLAAPTYNINANIDAFLSEKCSIITGTPTMHVDMLAQLKRRGETLSGLRVALAAGAPCSPQLIRDIQKHMNVQSVKVVDERGEMVPFGSPGELLTRGYNNMICYWDEPEKTSNTIDKDGWVSTGDKFTITEDGYGRIVGRLKDIIVRGGENIAPKEIEDLLNTHPDIIESQLCAVLRVREGARVTLDDVTRHCSGHIARYKIPRTLRVTDMFPKTTSGKIQKFKVKELIEAGKL
ncbi:AMP dependent coa ligase [Operophtera brumata]|uniref:Medium-chain acyl-CoA ligase ACSF2, mitochondrial n=1 Tax=Operophtera brumata TaxID=104452 RepID=A0A0L7L7Z1_OPEBR|nr:AMP dependent coa ligase [Operophtera brumata]